MLALEGPPTAGGTMLQQATGLGTRRFAGGLNGFVLGARRIAGGMDVAPLVHGLGASVPTVCRLDGSRDPAACRWKLLYRWSVGLTDDGRKDL